MKYSEINVLSLLLKEERAAESLHDVLGGTVPDVGAEV